MNLWKVLFIWPFLVGIGKMLLPNLIRTAVPLVANWAVSKIGGPPTAPQSAAYYDEEVLEEEDDFEEDYEEEEE